MFHRHKWEELEQLWVAIVDPGAARPEVSVTTLRLCRCGEIRARITAERMRAYRERKNG